MQKTKSHYLLIDFDSTFIQSEGLEELAEIALIHNHQKNTIIKQISDLTEKGMTGETSFEVSLIKRIELLQANKTHVEKLGEILKKKISPSILRNKAFFKQHKETIFIVSGGFKEFILPVVTTFGISPDHVFANTFIFDEIGNITGIDKTNPLAQDDGKVKLVKSLGLENDLIAIGDGYTDYRLKESGLVKQFIAFIENVNRKNVTQRADYIAPTFENALSFLPLTFFSSNS